jgi:hypothetical protein
MTAIDCQPTIPQDLESLYEIWYDLQVLRLQLNPSTLSIPRKEEWITSIVAQINTSIAFTARLDNSILGAIMVGHQRQQAQLTLWVVDIHHPKASQVNSVMFNALKQVLLKQEVCLLNVLIHAPLPIEQAFWITQGAKRTPEGYQLSLC